MQEQHLFEYAVIRVVPKVEREEFFNAGVILYCPGQKFLHTKINLPQDRLHALCGNADTTELKEFLASFEKICAGGPDGGPIGLLPMAERFRWLTATRSTVVQTSKVHSGLCTNAAETLEKLFEQLVS